MKHGLCRLGTWTGTIYISWEYIGHRDLGKSLHDNSVSSLLDNRVIRSRICVEAAWQSYSNLWNTVLGRGLNIPKRINNKVALGIMCFNSTIPCLVHRAGSGIVWTCGRLWLPHKGVYRGYVSAAAYWALACIQTKNIVFIGIVITGLDWGPTKGRFPHMSPAEQPQVLPFLYP